jgi:hypothetical protein
MEDHPGPVKTHFGAVVAYLRAVEVHLGGVSRPGDVETHYGGVQTHLEGVATHQGHLRVKKAHPKGKENNCPRAI